MAKQAHLIKVTLGKVFDDIKHYIADNNLTLEEVSSITGVDADFIMMLFENTDNISANIDKLISFSNVSLFSRITRRKKPVIYRWQHNFRTTINTMKLLRIVKPISTALYNPKTKELYNLKIKEKVSNAYRQLIINEMYDYIDKSNSKRLIDK